MSFSKLLHDNIFKETFAHLIWRLPLQTTTVQEIIYYNELVLC